MIISKVLFTDIIENNTHQNQLTAKIRAEKGNRTTHLPIKQYHVNTALSCRVELI